MKERKKIILLITPPYLVPSWEEEKENKFLNLATIANSKTKLKELKKEGKLDILSFIKDLNKKDFSDEVLKALENCSEKKLILVNYPLTKEKLEELEETFESNGKNIKTLIFIYKQAGHFEEIVSSLKVKKILCPACEKVYDKEINIKDGNLFCPVDEITFSQKEIEEFTNFYNNFYEENYSQEKLAEIIKHHQSKKREIIHPQLLMREDFDLNNLRKYLSETISKI